MRPQRSRPQHLLTREKVAELIRDNKTGRRADGGNLYLDIPGAGRAPAWVVRYKSPSTGKEREYRIGGEADYTLALARARALEVRQQLDAGVDPLDAREAQRKQAAAESVIAQQGQARAGATLRAEAEALHEMMIKAGRFKTPKAERQWLSRIENNVPRALWLKPIAAITEEDMGFMEELWATKHPTARKLRQRLEAIFHRARKHAPLNIAAVIRRDLQLVKSEHVETPHRSLPFAEVPAFVAQLRTRPGTSARALEFGILTSARTAEVIGLEWTDIRGGVWTVPAGKMKERHLHTVHLSKPALAVLEQVRGLDRRIVFPSETKAHAPMSNMAMLNLVERMSYKERTTVHGICRGSFSAWAYSQQRWSEATVECCLAHAEADRVKRAYNAGQNLAVFQADLWRAWSEFIEGRAPGKRRTRLKVVA